MRLYYSPGACSLAPHIVAREAGIPIELMKVDLAAKLTDSGEDFRAVNPKGLVPALRTDDGEVLTENAAILQYLADRFPDAGLAPTGFQRYRLQQWLSFIGSELHKYVFTPLLNPKTSPEARTVATEAAKDRFAYLNGHLQGREWLLDKFSVADAYLTAVLNWAQAVKFDLDAYPAVAAYRDRVRARPAVARALGEEFALYQPA